MRRVQGCGVLRVSDCRASGCVVETSCLERFRSLDLHLDRLI